MRWSTALIGGVALGIVLIVMTAENKPSTPEEIAAAAARDAERAAAEAAEEAERRAAGFHCLSAWDGSHRDLIAALTPTLRNPDSFQHIATRITPVNADGVHVLFMEYRAENGFGGMNVGQITAAVDPDTCAATILTTSDN